MESNSPRVSSTILIFICGAIGFVSLLSSAYLLWQSHRALGIVALLGIFLGATPLISFPVGIGFFVYAKTDSIPALIVSSVIASVLMLGIFLILERRRDPSGDLQTNRKSIGRKIATVVVVLLALYGAIAIIANYGKSKDSSTNSAGITATYNPSDPCDGVKAWGNDNVKRSAVLDQFTNLFSIDKGAPTPTTQQLENARDVSRGVALEQKASNPPAAAEHLNNIMFNTFNATADSIDAFLKNDRSTASVKSQILNDLLKEGKTENDKLTAQCS